MSLYERITDRLSQLSLLRCVLISFIAVVTLTATDCPSTAPIASGNFDPRFYSAGITDGSFYNSPGVNAIAVDESTGNVFVGGRFSAVGNVSAYNIAMYDPTQNRWFPLGEMGLENTNGGGGPEVIVYALTISGRHLFVGGKFSQTHEGITPNLNNIADYNIDTGAWSALANGLNNTVRALAVSGGNLYAGGDFLQANNSSASMNHIGFIEIRPGEPTFWLALPNDGLNGSVLALANVDGAVVAGGTFTGTFDGNDPNLTKLAIYYNGFVSSIPGVNGSEVSALAYSANSLYVGGDFDAPNGNINLARYDIYPNSGWVPITEDGLNGKVTALSISGNLLFAGGSFTHTNNGATINLNKIALYHISTGLWETLPGNGLDNDVNALANSGTSLPNSAYELYLGGKFRFTFNVTNSVYLNGVAKFGFVPESFSAKKASKVLAADWSPMGAARGVALNSTVTSVAADANDYVYVGGNFWKTEDGRTINLNSIARYDPSENSWSPLAHNGLNGGVTALAVSGTDLYVAGSFTQTFDGGVNLNHIARYDLTSQTWTPLPNNGLNNFITALAVSGTDLFVGGGFSATADGTVTGLRNIARYDTLTGTWSPLSGNGLNSSVTVLTVSGNDLYAGGVFTQVFDGSVTGLRNIARYSAKTGTWSGLANGGLNSSVYGLTSADGFVFVRGEFFGTSDNSTTLDRLARYNTADDTWAGITGAAADRTALLNTSAEVRLGNERYIAGFFTGAPTGPAHYFTRLYLQQWNVPALTTNWFDDTNWTTGAAPAANSNAVIPVGSGTINITTADVTMNDLMVNGGTLTIGPGRTLTINGVLGLYGGSVTGGGTVVIAHCSPDSIVGSGSTAYVQTALVRCVDSSGTFNFPVGTANGYSPVTLKDITGSGNVSIRANQGAYSGPATGLPALRLSRWWQIQNPGGGLTSSNLFFGYLQSDLTGSEGTLKTYRIAGGTATMISSSVNPFSNVANAPNVTAFSDWTLASLSPTAAAASVGGRVTRPDGTGVSGVRVTLSDSAGSMRTITTGAFGYYRFDDVSTGQTYVLSVSRKSYIFDPSARIVAVNEELTDVDFVGESGP